MTKLAKGVLTDDELARLVLWTYTEDEMVSILMDHMTEQEMRALLPLDRGALPFVRRALDDALLARDEATRRVSLVQRVAEQVVGVPAKPGLNAAHERELLSLIAAELGLADG